MIASSPLAEPLKVVYHLNEVEKTRILISSIKELLASDPEAQIEVVIHGPAIVRLDKASGLRAQIESLIEQGVIIGACSTSMLNNKLRPGMLIDGITELKQGGVLRIIQLQKQGFWYIKI